MPSTAGLTQVHRCPRSPPTSSLLRRRHSSNSIWLRRQRRYLAQGCGYLKNLKDTLFYSARAAMTVSTLFTCSSGNGMQISNASKNLFSDVKPSISLYKSSLFLKQYKNNSVACLTTKGLLEMGHSRSHFLFRSQCSSIQVGNLSITAEPKFQLVDVIESQQFDRDSLDYIFKVALEMESIEKKSSGSKILDGFLMATLFYEPSTRTRLSFESAMKRLGGEVLTTENAREFSSAAKGETLEDTIRTVEGYSDIIVLRHFESGAARRAAATANIPVINAGDGPGQHPTQALLDVYTIGRELDRFDGIKLGLVGDLANGRTVRSLAYLIAKYQDIKIYFVSPDVVKMKDDIKDYLTSKSVEWEESTDLLDVASKCDVIYQTRIQRERFGERIDLYEAARGKYIVDKEVLSVMPRHAVVMHPLPRLDEITLDVDSDPRAAYFRQAKNGLYIRMALLKLLLLG